jgi:cell division protein FtsW
MSPPLLQPRVDPVLLFAVLALTTLGIVMVTASSGASDAVAGDAFAHVRRQLAFAAVGAVLLIAGASIETDAWERRAPPIVAAALILLVLVLIPGIGHAAGGARRWLQLGPIGVQAGEIAKIAFVIHVASTLARRSRQGRDDRSERSARGGRRSRIRARAFVVPIAIASLLLLEPDFGTCVLLATVGFAMVFVTGTSMATVAALAAVTLPVVVVAVSSSAYRMRRVLAFLDPWAHRLDDGYQVTESLMTFGSGGLLGSGLGQSRQVLFLPAAHNDFIFAVIGDELGFVGALFVLGCFAVVAWRGLRAAANASSSFRGLFAIGLTCLFVLQATINIAVVVGLVPPKGITLPFVSYGGSSLLSSLFAAGLLLRVCADAGTTSRAGADVLVGRLAGRLLQTVRPRAASPGQRAGGAWRDPRGAS